MLKFERILAVTLIAWSSFFLAGTSLADVDPIYELLFIHHSSGRNWVLQHLATGVASLGWAELHSAGYREPEQTDTIAYYTDPCHWSTKFSTQLNLVFTFDHSNNVYYSDGRQNDLILFKSCFPSSDITGYGTPPGSPTDCARTVWNYKAAFLACAPIFAQHPEKLFIPLTTLPRSYWDAMTDPAANMTLTREFNNWLKNDYLQWYRSTYSLSNVAVFDAFDILAWGPSGAYPNYLRADFISGGWGGYNSHPDTDGNYALTYGYTDPDDGRVLPGFLTFLTAAVEEWQNGGEDTTPPTGTILINGGAAYTASQQATLTLQAQDGGSGMSGGGMRFRNEAGGWSAEVPYASTQSWNLSSGDGSKTVSVLFRDAAGNWMTAPVLDSVILDTLSPGPPENVVVTTVTGP